MNGKEIMDSNLSVLLQIKVNMRQISTGRCVPFRSNKLRKEEDKYELVKSLEYTKARKIKNG